MKPKLRVAVAKGVIEAVHTLGGKVVSITEFHPATCQTLYRGGNGCSALLEGCLQDVSNETLLEFVCPSKNDYNLLSRIALDAAAVTDFKPIVIRLI